MVAYTKPQQRKKQESKRLRGERDQMKPFMLYTGFANPNLELIDCHGGLYPFLFYA